MDFGLIGNCQYSALVDTQASIQWLCWPRFDSSSVFGKLLDPSLGSFDIVPEKVISSKQTYLKNTNVLTTYFETKTGKLLVQDFAPRFLLYGRPHRPTSLIRILRPLEGEPQVTVSCNPVGDFGRQVPKIHWGSNHIEFQGLPDDLRLTTNASRTLILENRPFVLTEDKYFVLSWGAPLEDNLQRVCEHFLAETISYWRAWVKHCAIPNVYQKEVIRSALTLKLHQFEDTGGIIAATTTSLPEAHLSGRNWDYRYCWLRDAYFILSSLRHLGQFEEMEHFVEFLANLAEAPKEYWQPLYDLSGGACIHEKTLDHLAGYQGNKPVRIGNAAYDHLQTDVFGELLMAIEPIFMDERFSGSEHKKPFHLVTKIFNQLKTHAFEKDAGIWEFRDARKLHTFSLLMHWAGCNVVLRMAERYPELSLANEAQALRSKMVGMINESCWDENLQSYVQASGEQDLDAATLMLVNLKFGAEDPERMNRFVDAISQGLDAGNGLLYRYLHKDDFGKPQSAFTVCSFWLVEALAKLGRTEEARIRFEQMLTYANHLGLYSEDLDPKTGQQWGNFPQTYSHAGLINAAFALDER